MIKKPIISGDTLIFDGEEYTKMKSYHLPVFNDFNGFIDLGEHCIVVLNDSVRTFDMIIPKTLSQSIRNGIWSSTANVPVEWGKYAYSHPVIWLALYNNEPKSSTIGTTKYFPLIFLPLVNRILDLFDNENSCSIIMDSSDYQDLVKTEEVKKFGLVSVLKRGKSSDPLPKLLGIRSYTVFKYRIVCATEKILWELVRRMQQLGMEFTIELKGEERKSADLLP